MTAKSNVLDMILGGEADADLDAIVAAVRERRSILNRRAADALAGSLSAGDKVRFTGGIRPRYLAGVQATVVRVNRTTATVTIDDKAQAGRFGGSVRCPLNLIQASA